MDLSRIVDARARIPASISAEKYGRRRREFIARIGPTAAALVPAAPVAVRSNDVEYPYRQDNDFLYLTGFPEPEAVALFLPGRTEGEFLLFVRPRDRERETWTGRRAGVDGALERYGADAAFPLSSLEEKVVEFVAQRETLYYALGRDSCLNERVLSWSRQWRQTRPRSGSGPTAIHDPGAILHEMRVRKDEEELACMREAAKIAAAGHRAALRETRDGSLEYEIEAVIDGTFRSRGASGPAYPTIVASGGNATILHYTENDRRMRAGDLLLVDAGAEYAGYCADITRTFPVAATFSAAQRALYDVVLRAQLVAIDAVRPGARIDEPHARALDVIVDGLLALGLLVGERREILATEGYKRFFMHRTSHWLGMDVHDVGSYKSGAEARILEPGMVLTVEPGLYVAADEAEVDERFRGLGVRIEDDVLVTNAGSEVLSAEVPKGPEEIEAIRGEALARQLRNEESSA